MKLIIDQNLPKSLAALLEPHFPGTVHVKQVQFDRKDDTDLWSYAKEKGFTILSKDKDFEQWSTVRGTPPKVIWLRMGNSSSGQMPLSSQANWWRSSISWSTRTGRCSFSNPEFQFWRIRHNSAGSGPLEHARCADLRA